MLACPDITSGSRSLDNKPMKILYFANVRIPTEKAHGLQIIKTCEALVDQGAEIELILPTRRNKYLKKIGIFDFYNIEKRFKFKKIFCLDPWWLIFVKQGLYIKIQTTFFILSLFFYLLFKPQKADFSFYTRDEQLLSLLQFFSKKVFWETHNLSKNSGRYLKYWQKCAGIIAITKGLKNDLINRGLKENKIIVAPDGVDLKKFNPPAGGQNSKSEIRKEMDLPLDKKIIMYTGNLYGWKGADILAAAAEFLPTDTLIIFIGGSWFELAEFKKRYSEIKNIKILSFQKPEKIPAYLKTADVLVIPNSGREEISSRYTSPLKMFEYMTSGVPIVASDLPSMREILNDKNAVLIKPDEPQELARGIKKVLQETDLSAKIATQAQKDVQNYTWQKRAKKILNFITVSL